MREFKRITRVPNVNNGLPSIRDTGITVSEVVSQLIHQKSAEEVIRENPVLDVEDIEEALVFAVSDLQTAIRFTIFDIRNPLTTMPQFFKYALSGVNNQIALTDGNEELLKSLYNQSYRTLNLAMNLYDWVQFVYEDPNWQGKGSQSLQEILNRFTSQHNETEVSLVNLQLPEDIYKVAGHWSLPTVFSTLIRDDFYQQFEIFAKVVCANSEDNEHVRVHIQRRFTRPDMTQMSVEDLLNYPATPISLAALILYQHGSKLKIQPIDGGVEFEFDLPVWKEDNRFR